MFDDEGFSEGPRSHRKLKERQRFHRQSAIRKWQGRLALMLGSIGIPGGLGLALGSWLDGPALSSYPWTKMFLFIGLAIAALQLWYWVKHERGPD